ncbi:MAG: hypothetical protein HY515_01805 [Candidatus Aenigmarchaeota archaeon]|nr:hypothetical protein [Candidatus Aenigmarchaeota archaeon]
MKTGYLLLLVAITLMVSGCTDTTSPGSGGAGGETPALKNNEVVVLENIEAVPNDVKPERNFLISGFVTNNAKTKINGVIIELADYCSSVFDVTKTSCSLTSFDNYADCTFFLNPEASSKFQWGLKAPPASRTAGRDFDCNMVVKTNYSYSAYGSTGVILANDAEIAARETGPSPVTGDGPLKIYITVESAQPVGRGETFDVKIVLKNEGAGELERAILKANFKINMPEGLTGNCDVPETITTTKTKTESDPIFCAFTTPNTLPPRVTKFVTAEANYDYKFTSTVPVKLSVVKRA